MKILSPIQVGFGECYYFCACLLKILLHEFDIKRQKRQRPRIMHEQKSADQIS